MEDSHLHTPLIFSTWVCGIFIPSTRLRADLQINALSKRDYLFVYSAAAGRSNAGLQSASRFVLNPATERFRASDPPP